MIIDLSIIQKACSGDISPDTRSYVLENYKLMFGNNIPNPECSNCAQDAAIQILIKMNESRKYILFAHIPIEINGKWYTQPTLTDELAELHLKEHPEDICKFKKYPKQAKTPKTGSPETQ